jgi:hypothetical protein
MNIRTRTRALLATAPLIAAWLAVASPAQASPLVASAEDCDTQELSQPFLPWADPANYTLAPNGGFEQGGSGWSLDGGAAVGSGNESYYVRDAGDTRSLRLPNGSTATSAAMCVGIEHPTLRFFARNTGSPLSTLKVSVLFVDGFGETQSVPIGIVSAGGSWQPTAPMVIGVNLLPLLPGERTPVAFEFTPKGAGGEWRIDDVYVDPYRRS